VGKTNAKGIIANAGRYCNTSRLYSSNCWRTSRNIKGKYNFIHAEKIHTGFPFSWE
jgi:hypothetical protein